MYVESIACKRKDKVYWTHLLRESYREDGKVKHRTIANISRCTPEQIEAIRIALKYSKNLDVVINAEKDVQTHQGSRLGLVLLLDRIAHKVGLHAALGRSKEGRLALLQVYARLSSQGSRLSAVRFAASHGVAEVLGLSSLTEDDLYRNLQWLAKNQAKIQKKLFRFRYKDSPPRLFLYDVTSTYLEGSQNYFAQWGYNRDKKQGKKQIVVGLLTDPEGIPVAVEAFQGNCSDTQTVQSQLETLKKRFGVRDITFVGDRGMLKGPQQELVKQQGYHYITAISKSQIRKLLKQKVVQLELFDEKLQEVEVDGVRYILRRNPNVAYQTQQKRYQKIEKLQQLVEERNEYLANHPRAKPEVALKKIRQWATKLQIRAFVRVWLKDRTIRCSIRRKTLKKAEYLDGCYVLKTDLPAGEASKEFVHQRYKDLALIEQAFRTTNSAHLEIRPVFVRKKESTIGHILVVMMAYLLEKELRKLWKNLNVTVQEGLDEIGSIRGVIVQIQRTNFQKIPQPKGLTKQLLDAAGVQLPELFPLIQTSVASRKKLPSERK